MMQLVILTQDKDVRLNPCKDASQDDSGECHTVSL
jgi:hypothetical protein